MKRFFLVIVLILLGGCAAKQELITYPAPQTVRNRPAVAAYQKARDCLKLSDDGISTDIRFVQTKQLAAWIDGDNTVHFTEGLFRYDDIAVTFIITHELSHAKLNHIRNRNIVSGLTTGVMTAAGFIVPGAGYLNSVVNPAITRNFGKSQELDADRLASETLVKCFGVSIDQQIPSLKTWLYDGPDGGGFWATHPSAADRIANIRKLQSPSISTGPTP